MLNNLTSLVWLVQMRAMNRFLFPSCRKLWKPISRVPWFCNVVQTVFLAIGSDALIWPWKVIFLFIVFWIKCWMPVCFCRTCQVRRVCQKVQFASPFAGRWWIYHSKRSTMLDLRNGGGTRKRHCERAPVQWLLRILWARFQVAHQSFKHGKPEHTRVLGQNQVRFALSCSHFFE